MKTLLRTAALTALAAGALAAPAGAQGPAQTCKADPTGPFGEPAPSFSTCVTYANTGTLTGTGYVAQCRLLTGGRYPFTFYGQVTVTSPGECLNALRGFHTSFPG